MNRYRFARWVVIGGVIMILLDLAGPVGAASSVDLVLTPSHNPPFASGQPAVYIYGEPVAVNITLTNHGPGPITIMGFPPKRGISQRNQTDFLTFPRTSETATIGPGRTLAYDVIWDQKNAKGIQVDSGLYTIGVYYLLSEDTGGIWDLSNIEPYARTVDIVILPKGGALTADIPANPSQVVDNVSITLESIHLTNITGQVNFKFQVPEDIPFRTHPAGWKMCYLDFLSVEAQYSIDHNTPRQFFIDSVNCEPPHTFQSTYELDPIPVDAKEMEIKLTISGSHLGSSVFHVNLTPYSSSGTMAGSPNPVSPTRPSPLSPVVVIGLLVCAAFIVSRRCRK